MSFSIDFEVLKNQANKKAVQADASPENNEIDNLERKISNQLNSTEHKTRSWLTTGFIFGLFLLIILSGVYVPIHNAAVLDLAVLAKKSGVDIKPDNLKFISFESVYSLLFNSLGTSLGFIIGYYFKEKVSK